MHNNTYIHARTMGNREDEATEGERTGARNSRFRRDSRAGIFEMEGRW